MNGERDFVPCGAEAFGDSIFSHRIGAGGVVPMSRECGA
ncbi:hypothetical protein SAMN06297129_3622 [Pseudooceanicola antarcticus]|uniref:Uncharacterized protein n=1 Tax=Pseudooceanicola antarcticus TaxID=1247613 RepID=A0A285JEZ5_9RHOB|nr:hypothetical protein SAMN06297129_3622 [Pseudooceanicola antarcticus]